MSTATHALDPALPPADALARLQPGARRLVATVAALYDGDWQACAEDLRRRLAGRPYLYRVDIPGVDALAWLQRFQAYETARGERLAPTSLETAENRP